ncbi:citrate synthase-lysine N-methyltransferase CSKMT, mitochondrial isoform X1 [Meles meles]|uniref:citrate synthase-lysine N-methyltransferase CSKMT, mitochondrial isoform X1 n=1 Tax=Meles meles TaxID=9662 RepID=UPI001E69F2CF|nr:citrate synthase-lysine N-methyltransferase CSKMT, mitochondrial isoform X1 [Meles meles]
MYGGRGKGLWPPRRHVFGARGVQSAGSILKRRDTASGKRGGREVLQAPPSCAHAFSFDFRSLEPPLEPELSCSLFNCRLQTIKDDRTLIGSLAGSCLADRRLWDKLHADTPKGHVPTFDWFFGYEETQGLLLPLLQETAAACPLRVLDVGCGTSSLCTGLYTQCPHPVDVLGVDFSPVAIAHMKRLLEGGEGQTPLCPGHPASRLHFMQADAQNLEPVASSGSFQLVLDKGTWDAVARGGPEGAYQLLSECLRVLSPQGTLIQFSDEDPDVRLPYLEQGSPGWSVTVQELGPFGGMTYFAYLVQGSH